jgi:hypothetical protein
MLALAMITKVQKMLNSLQTADPFETSHKNTKAAILKISALKGTT